MGVSRVKFNTCLYKVKCVGVDHTMNSRQQVMYRVYIRAGTNTPSDEYDSYREYRVANTNIYSRIQ